MTMEPVSLKHRNGEWHWTLPESPLPGTKPRLMRWGVTKETTRDLASWIDEQGRYAWSVGYAAPYEGSEYPPKLGIPP